MKRTAVAVRGLYMDIIHHHGLIEPCKLIHAPYGKGPDGLAVIPIGKAHEAGPFTVACLELILEGNLEGGLNRGRSIIVEMEFCQPLRQKGQEPFCKGNGRFMGAAGKDHMFELFQLGLDAFIDGGVAMPQEIGPPGTDDIKIGLPLFIIEPGPFCVIHKRGGRLS